MIRDMAIMPVGKTLFTGVDVGGTKVHILDSSSDTLHRYETPDYPNMEAILDDYFLKIGKRPASIGLAMAGPRDDETGAVKLTNGHWPAFEPLEAAKRYPGTKFETVNDMAGSMAGVLVASSLDLEQLKPGTATQTGTKVVVTLSTGFGAAAAAWDKVTSRYVIIASEGGHIGVYPHTTEEAAYVTSLQQKHPRVSAELAIAGKFGMPSLVAHMLASHADSDLAKSVATALEHEQPVGAVLLAFAQEGEGRSQELAHQILSQLGALFASTLRDLAVTFKATGGIYLTGSISYALSSYLAAKTMFIERFVHKGAPHDTWLANLPIYLITDPRIAVKGALEIAKQA